MQWGHAGQLQALSYIHSMLENESFLFRFSSGWLLVLTPRNISSGAPFWHSFPVKFMLLSAAAACLHAAMTALSTAFAVVALSVVFGLLPECATSGPSTRERIDRTEQGEIMFHNANAAALQPGPQGWSTWLGSSARTGAAACEGIANTSACCSAAAVLDPCTTNSSVAWTFPRETGAIECASSVGTASVAGIIGPLLSSAVFVAVRDGQLAIQASSDGRIFALNASNGCAVWVINTNSTIVATPTVTTAQVVIVPTMSSFLYALDGASGDLLWRTNFTVLGYPVKLSTAVAMAANGAIIIAVDSAFLAALHPDNGTVIWQAQLQPINPRPTPAVALNGTLAIACSQQVVYRQTGIVAAFHVSNGTLAWTYVTTKSCTSVSSQGDILYVMSTDPVGYTEYVVALWAQNGSVVWRSGAASGTGAPIVVTKTGTVVATGWRVQKGYDTMTYALDMATGRQLWNYQTLRPWSTVGTYSPVAGYDGAVYVSLSNSLFSLDGKTGLARWRLDLPCGPLSAPPSFSPDGTLLLSLPCASIPGVNASLIALRSTPSSSAVMPLWPSATSSPSSSPSMSHSASPTMAPTITATTTASAVPVPLNSNTWYSANADSQRSSALAAEDTNCHSSGGSPVWQTVFLPVSQVPLSTQVPTLDAEHVFVCDANGTVHALDANSGALLWHFDNVSTGPGASRSGCKTTVSPEGLLYVPCADGVRALNSSTGALIWFTPTSGGAYGSPLLGTLTGYVFVSTSNTNYLWHALKLNRYTGILQWEVPVPGLLCVSPPLDSGEGMLAFTLGVQSGPLAVYSARDGGALWHTNYTQCLGCPVAAVIPGSQQAVFVTAVVPYQISVNDAAYGTTVWQTYMQPGAGSQISQPAVTRGGVVIMCAVSSSTTLMAVSLATGKQLWRTQLPGCSIYTAPSVGADGTVYVTSVGMNIGQSALAAVHGDTGAIMWRQLLDQDITIVSGAIIDARGRLFVQVYSQSQRSSSIWAFPVNCPSPSTTPSPSPSYSATPSASTSNSALASAVSVPGFTPALQTLTAAGCIVALAAAGVGVLALLRRCRRAAVSLPAPDDHGLQLAPMLAGDDNYGDPLPIPVSSIHSEIAEIPLDLQHSHSTDSTHLAASLEYRRAHQYSDKE